MKKLSAVCFVFFLSASLDAQSVGIGTKTPWSQSELTVTDSLSSSKIYIQAIDSLNGLAGVHLLTHSNNLGFLASNFLRFPPYSSPITYYGYPSSNLTALTSDALGGLLIGTGENFPIMFMTNAAERIRIDEAGNIGIATTTPAAKLDIVYTGSTIAPLRVSTTGLGNVTLGAVQLEVGSGNNSYGEQIANAGNNHGLYINNSSSTNANNALYAITAGTGNAASIFSTNTANTNATLNVVSYGSGTGGFFHKINNGTAIHARVDGLGVAGDFETNGTGPAVRGILNSSGSAAAGNFVNIGSFGNALWCNVTDAGNSASVILSETSGNGYTGRFINGSGIIIEEASSISKFHLSLYETSTGYARLHFKNNNGAAWTVAAIRTGSSSTDQLNFYNEQAGADRFIFYGNGNATFSGILTQLSDERLKRNIVPLNNVLEKLNTINAYTYNWKEESRGADEQVGFLAQEIEKVFPQVVRTDDKGNKSVAYQNLVPVLLQAIKELQVQIDEMKKIIQKK